MRHPVEPILLEGGGIRWVDPVNNKTPRRQEVASMTRDQAAKAIKADIGEDAAARFFARVVDDPTEAMARAELEYRKRTDGIEWQHVYTFRSVLRAWHVNAPDPDTAEPGADLGDQGESHPLTQPGDFEAYSQVGYDQPGTKRIWQAPPPAPTAEQIASNAAALAVMNRSQQSRAVPVETVPSSDLDVSEGAALDA